MEWFWIVGAVAFFAAVGLAVWIVSRIRTRIRQISRSALGTDSLLDGLKMQQEMISQTPKSVSGMTKIYLPQIVKDFPAFQYEEFRQKAENMLLSAFVALSRQDISFLQNASEELRKQVSVQIENAMSRGVRMSFLDPKIYQTEISAYRKGNGRCCVVLQSAVGYYRFEEENGRLVSGSRDVREQTKYDIELVYVQDRSQVESARSDKALGLTCPNCGAPVTSLGDKTCPFCGSVLEEVNRYAWAFDRFTEA